MSEGFTIEGKEKIEMARWMAIRAGLAIQAKTGLTHSKISYIRLANKITGQKDRTARKAHASLNAKIVEAIGPDFDRPL